MVPWPITFRCHHRTTCTSCSGPASSRCCYWRS